MAATDKDTIYVDIDDEITTIIDKVQSSDARIVALVLPKRATVFQSIVNMKLLKRTADVEKKRVVLITSEASLMPLAGAVGLYVANTPQSKPEIPSAAEPTATDEIEEAMVDEDEEEYTADNAGNRPIGDLAHRSGHVIAGALTSNAETLDENEEESSEEPEAPKKSKRHAKNRHLSVPNFNKFRARLFIGGFLLILLLAGLYYANVVMPKAAITITTNASTVNVSLAATLDPSASTLDTTKSVLPAKTEQQQKTTSQQVNTTGQKNNGQAASGTVIMTAGACTYTQPDSVPHGTGISNLGHTYITQNDASFGPTVVGGHCVWQSGSVNITAISGGAAYNTNGTVTFSVNGRTSVTASGSAKDGTDDITNIVAQADIDNAKQKLAAADTSAIKSTLEQALVQDGMYPMPDTFNAGTPVITSSANVGDAADTVTVTQAVTYTMFGAKQTDLDTLIKNSVSTQIDTKSQSILDDGLSAATFNVTNNAGSTVQFSLQTTATIGPDISADSIKKQAAGKKVGDVKALVNTIPGVTNVDVQLSPFWVSSVPTNQAKITVTISKPKSATHGN